MNIDMPDTAYQGAASAAGRAQIPKGLKRAKGSNSKLSVEQQRKKNLIDPQINASAFVYRNSATEHLTILLNRWDIIAQFFTTNAAAIESARVNLENFQNLPASEQLVLLKAGKALFEAFRQTVTLPAPTTNVLAEIPVPSNLQNYVMSLMSYMKKTSGYKDQAPAAPDSVPSAVKDAASLTTFYELQLIVATGEWPSTWPAANETDKSGKNIIAGKLKQCVRRAGVSKHEVDVAKDARLKALLRQMKESNYEGVPAGYMSNLSDLLLELYNSQMVGTENNAQFMAQEANLDRVFHMCYVLHKVCNSSVEKVKQCINSMITRIRGVHGEAQLVDLLNNSVNATVKQIVANLDGIGRGRERTEHKYQHPLMVTMKRFMMGLSSITTIPCTGHLLNGLRNDAESVARICAFWLLDVQCEKRQMDRNSTWIFHNFLKGENDTWVWTGNKRGNAFNCKFTIVPEVRMPLLSQNDIDTADWARKTSSQMTDDILAQDAMNATPAAN